MAVSWQIWAVLAAAFAAVTAIFAKIGLQDVPSDTAVWLRTIAILLALTLFLALSGQLPSIRGQLPGRSMLFLALSGIGAAASWVAYFRALDLGPVSLVAPIDKLSIALVAVLGVLVLRERVGWSQWLGIALVAVGAVLSGSG